MFESQRVRLVTILAVWAVALATLAAVGKYETARADSAVHKDRAAVQAAAHRLSYGQVVDAWTRTKLFDGAPLADIQSSIGVLPRSVHEEGKAIILTFGSGYGSKEICIDLTVRPDGNTVRIRSC